MVRRLSYADAVKLVGGTESKAVKALDGILGGAILAAASIGTPFALALLGPKSELAKLSNAVVADLSGRMRGLSRFDRTERLTAAQRILVLAAYFEALQAGPIPDELRTRIVNWHSAEVAVGHELRSHRLDALTRALSDSDIPTSAPYQREQSLGSALLSFYQRLGEDLLYYVQGLPIWEGMSGPERIELDYALLSVVPALASENYLRLFQRLAADFPEVAYWAGQHEHVATRAELRSVSMSLAGLSQAFDRLMTSEVPEDRRQALARSYRAALDKPIIETGLGSDELAIPALGDAYIDPEFRVAAIAPDDHLDQEGWWERHPVREDLHRFLVGYLTSLDAVEHPLILLGQPGSGKSVLTKVIAARLPPSDFLVVRVPLSEVPADIDLQSQVEFAIRETTGETLSWPALARTAGGALPLLILDGFDELLQATGASRTDFLEQVVRFQEREADQGRPVAVIVTSRTAVADRAWVPRRGAVAVKLEPFSKFQVAKWLEIWGEINAVLLQRRSLRPLPATAASQHPELSSQPLLLFMLAMYDAVANALQTEDGDLSKAELYDQILVSFIEREISKSRPGLSREQRNDEVERELTDLSVAAFSMANRGRQWVTEEELNNDFRALFKRPTDVTISLSAPLSAAQTVTSRFFFVHQARARRDGEILTACEFLHATFGEFLLARLIYRELTFFLALIDTVKVRDRRGVDDAFSRFLCPILSFVPLSARGQAIEFLAKLMDRLRANQRTQLRAVLIELFARLNETTQPSAQQIPYEPVRLTTPARYAAVSANLLLLSIVVGGAVKGSELFPQAASSSVLEWRRCAFLWRAQFTPEDWRGLALILHLERRWEKGQREVSISLGPWEPPPLDLYWSYGFPLEDKHRRSGGWRYPESRALRRESYLVCDLSEDIAWHTLEPFTRGLPMPVSRMDHVTSSIGVLSETEAVSTGHVLIELWLASCGAADDAELAEAYGACLTVIDGSRPPDQIESHTAMHRRVLRMMAADADRLPLDLLARAKSQFSATVLRAEHLTNHPEIQHWAVLAFARLAEPLT